MSKFKNSILLLICVSFASYAAKSGRAPALVKNEKPEASEEMQKLSVLLDSKTHKGPKDTLNQRDLENGWLELKTEIVNILYIYGNDQTGNYKIGSDGLRLLNELIQRFAQDQSYPSDLQNISAILSQSGFDGDKLVAAYSAGPNSLEFKAHMAAKINIDIEVTKGQLNLCDSKSEAVGKRIKAIDERAEKLGLGKKWYESRVTKLGPNSSLSRVAHDMYTAIQKFESASKLSIASELYAKLNVCRSADEAYVELSDFLSALENDLADRELAAVEQKRVKDESDKIDAQIRDSYQKHFGPTPANTNKVEDAISD